MLLQLNTVKGYEHLKDYYFVESEQGYVYSTGRGYMKRLKGTSSNGYLRVGLTTKNDEVEYFLVHRLIAMAFVDNPNNYPTVDHINHVRNDNRACNLRWAKMTTGDNGQLNDIWFDRHKEQFESQKKRVMAIDEEKCSVIVFPSVKACAKYFNVTESNISIQAKKCGKCRGKRLKFVTKQT